MISRKLYNESRMDYLINYGRSSSDGGLIPSPKGFKVVFVDDDESLGGLVLHVLSQYGADLVLLRSGREAVSYFLKNSADLLITDWNLPEFNGSQILGGIQDNIDQRHRSEVEIPYIIYSGLDIDDISLPVTPQLPFIAHWSKKGGSRNLKKYLDSLFLSMNR